MSVSIRPASAADIDRMFEISIAAHRHGYESYIPLEAREKFGRRYRPSARNRDRYRLRMLSHLNNPGSTALVALSGGVVKGYLIAHPEGAQTRLDGLFVHPDFQGEGAGGMLLRHLVRRCSGCRIALRVIATNEKARRLYAKYGFATTGDVVATYFGAAQVEMVFKKHE